MGTARHPWAIRRDVAAASAPPLCPHSLPRSTRGTSRISARATGPLFHQLAAGVSRHALWGTIPGAHLAAEVVVPQVQQDEVTAQLQ